MTKFMSTFDATVTPTTARRPHALSIGPVLKEDPSIRLTTVHAS